MTTPAMSGPLVANPNPFHLPVGHPLGEVYVTGAVSGLGYGTDRSRARRRQALQSRTSATSRRACRRPKDSFQFFLQPGAYSLPTLSIPYKNVTDMVTGDKLRWPAGRLGQDGAQRHLSFQAGKLPTLIGAEYMFTFQNMNIERGLLWAQEPVIRKAFRPIDDRPGRMVAVVQ